MLDLAPEPTWKATPKAQVGTYAAKSSALNCSQEHWHVVPKVACVYDSFADGHFVQDISDCI